MASQESCIFVDDTWRVNLMTSMYSLQCRHLLCDAVIKPRDGNGLRAHSAVLAGCSPHLALILQERRAYHKSLKIKLSLGYTDEVLKLVLEFIYTGELKLDHGVASPDILQELAKVSEELGISPLLNWCTKKLDGNADTTLNSEGADSATGAHRVFNQYAGGGPHNADHGDESVTSNSSLPAERLLQPVSISSNSPKSFAIKFEIKKRRSNTDVKGSRKAKTEKLAMAKPEHTSTSEQPSQDHDMEIKGQSPVVQNKDDLTSSQEAAACSIDDNTGIGLRKLRLRPNPRPSRVKVRGNANATKTHWCTPCNKSFCTSYTLKRHIASRHSLIRPFKCDECDASFARSETLRGHSSVHATTTQSFPCRHCGKVFRRKPNCTAHENYHVDPARFKCSSCTKTFTHKRALDMHLLHQGKRNFGCEICGSSFYSAGRLSQHAKIHHDSSQRSRDHKCGVCQKAFFTRQSLACHSRSHTGDKPFGCQFCEKRFSQIGNCRLHERRHRGEKPFVCDICGAAFSVLDHLKGHAVTHSEERPFACEECGKRFKLARNLKLHQKIH